MDIMRTYFGSLECQPLITNQFRPPTNQIPVDDESGKADNENIELKENYAVFYLEKFGQDCDKLNEETEMDEDSFWSFVLSDEWSDFQTLRLCSSSILNELFSCLETLKKDGCIDFENIIHFDDSYPMLQAVGNNITEGYSARLQMIIYKFPESKFSFDEDETDAKDTDDTQPTESNSQTSDTNNEHSMDETINFKSSEFDEFYFRKTSPTLRSLHDSLEDFIKMRLCLKRSKHWDELSRSSEYKLKTYLHSKDDSKREDSDQSKSAVRVKSNKKGVKASKAVGKKSKRSTSTEEKSPAGRTPTNLETQLEERLRKPLWKKFEKKLDEIFKQTETLEDESKYEEKKSKSQKVKKPKKANKRESSETSRTSESRSTKSDIPLTPSPPPPEKVKISAKISYSDERQPILITRELRRCPDTIVLGKTCRSNTLWSLPTPARFKCHESKLYSFSWRSVSCVEQQRNKEDMRAMMEDDLTQLYNLGREEERVSNSSEGEGEIVDKIKPKLRGRKVKSFGSPIMRDARYSCRSIIKREINKVNNYKKKQATTYLLQNEVVPIGDKKAKHLEPSTFSISAHGFDREKSAEYLLAVMRKYNVKKEIISINACNWTQSFAYLTFNRPWKKDCNEGIS